MVGILVWEILNYITFKTKKRTMNVVHLRVMRLLAENSLILHCLVSASPCLCQRRTRPPSAGGRGAEGFLWCRELLPSGCGHSLVRAGPGSGRPEGWRSSAHFTPGHFIKPQTQQRQDLLCVGALLPPGFTQELWETVYMQCLPPVLADAHQR